MSRGRFWLFLALVGAVVLVPATGGFSAAGAERGISVAVADDPANAFVGIDGPRRLALDYGRTDDVVLFRLANNLGYPIEVRVSVSNDGTTPPDLDGPPAVGNPSLHPDDPSTAVTGDVVCAAAGDETWTVHVEAEGSAFSADIRHTVTVACSGRPASASGGGSNPSGADQGRG